MWNCLNRCQSYELSLYSSAKYPDFYGDIEMDIGKIFISWIMHLSVSLRPHSEKSLARSMLFYSRNYQHQNWAQIVLYINSECISVWPICDRYLQLWHKNHCTNTGYYSIFQLLLFVLLNNNQYNCNNTISSVSAYSSYILSSLHVHIIAIGTYQIIGTVSYITVFTSK